MAEHRQPIVKQEDIISPLKGYVAAHPSPGERDMLSGRYQILIAQPLPEFSSPFAKAYSVRDTQAPDAKLYALVHDTAVPLRHKNLVALKGFQHPALVSLVDHGTVQISATSQKHPVSVLALPEGEKLSQFLSRGKNPVSERTLITTMLRPLTEVLLAFQTLGISHNRINLSNVYIGTNTVMLGECIGEPSGFSQDPLFEPIDRILTSPFAKSDNAISADCYALGVLALHLALGFQPFAQLGRDELIQNILTKGSYHTLAIEWDFSDVMQDFFRGLLNDKSRDRWEPKVIENWLGGKRFSLIVPSQPRETSRGFEFAGETYYNRKSLAHAMFTHWAQARALLFDNKLPRWLEASLHKPDIAEAVSRVCAANNGDTPRAERHNNELVARVIMLLDPQGPIRLRHLAVTLDGFGLLLAQALATSQQDDLQALVQIVESDLTGFWAEQNKSDSDYTALIAKLQKIRTYMRMNAQGFGMERCVYEMFPHLPCQSPLIKQYCVTNLKELLYALDTVAPQKAAHEDCVDRHIAAFIACKLSIGKEVHIDELSDIKGLGTHPRLIMLKLLLRAQQKAGEENLRGLAHWAAFRVFTVLEYIHRVALRHELQARLREAADQGSLTAIAAVVLNADVFIADHDKFRLKSDEYALRRAAIARLKDKTYIGRHARMAGRGIAQTVAYGMCLMTIYVTLRSYFHF